MDELHSAIHDLSDVGKERKYKQLRDYATPEAIKGSETEQLVYKLLLTLDGIKDVQLAKRGSILDDEWKVDLAVTTTTERTYLFQVKSSERAASAAQLQYPDVPVIWLDTTKPEQRQLLLVEMVSFLHGQVAIKPTMKDAVRKRKALLQRGIKRLDTRLDSRTFPVEERYYLQVLGLALMQGDVLILGL